jgi:hypothetical protein
MRRAIGWPARSPRRYRSPPDRDRPARRSCCCRTAPARRLASFVALATVAPLRGSIAFSQGSFTADLQLGRLSVVPILRLAHVPAGPRRCAYLDGFDLRGARLAERKRVLPDLMQRARVEEDDVLEAARRLQGLERMEQIKYAVLEKSGGISIIPEE